MEQLTGAQAEQRLTAAWGHQAYVIPYRIAGNGYIWEASDHNGSRLPLERSWNDQGRTVFTPKDGDWPEQPDPLTQAYNAAREAFSGDAATLERLERALELVKAGQVSHRDGAWLVKSDGGAGSGAWTVGKRCDCPDATYRGQWCKHRLAVALVVKVQALGGGVDYAYLAEQARSSQAPEDGPVTQEMRDKWIAAAREKKLAQGLDPDLPITLQVENYGVDPQPAGRDHAFSWGYGR